MSRQLVVPLTAEIQTAIIDETSYLQINNGNNKRPKTYSKRTIFHQIYWLSSVIVLLLSAIAAFYIIIFHKDEIKSDSFIQIYFALFTARAIGFFGGFPISFYPTRYCKIDNYPLFPYNMAQFSNMVSACTYAIATLIAMEITLYVQFNINNELSTLTVVINVCEGICILYQMYVVIYRFMTKREDFWFAMVGDEIKKQRPEFIEYKEILYPDKYDRNCCYKIWYFIVHYILGNIWFLFEIFNILLFITLFGSLLLIGLVYTFIDLYIISILLCCWKRRKDKLLTIKRYSYFSDFLLFYVVLNEFRMDNVFAYFTQNPPFKELLISIILMFFQYRYFTRFLDDNSLPNYNLLNNEYTTYDVLTDCGRTTYTRWLPYPSKISNLPAPQLLANTLFLRNEFIPETNMRLSFLAACYIRYFTHQFANTHPEDANKVKGPIGINMSQLYDGPRLNKDGLFKFVMINNQEYPEIIGDDNHKQFVTPEDGPTGTNSPGYFMIHILFFRNHQYIARSLKNKYPEFDDDRIYETTKMINILILIKCTLALYGDVGIVQSTVPSTFTVDNLETLFKSNFYRLFGAVGSLYPSNATNIPIEFNILYRWHQLIPPKIELTRYIDDDSKQDQDDVDHEELTLPYPNAVDFLTQKDALETLLISSSKTNVGKLSLNNTDPLLVNMAVLPTIKKTRYYNLASFNDYRERFGFKRYESMEELTSNKETIKKLNELYGDNVDNVEFYVGIFAEDKIGNALHGSFMTAVFASTVITLLTSSPLLRKDWNKMLTPLGRQIVNDINSLSDVVELHTKLLKSDVSTRVNKE